ncbi:hypothetical protein Ac2012v2_001215 [Leucoagaricus gongylophorus]
MTPQQVNVFMEERKWDYRGKFEATPPSLFFSCAEVLSFTVFGFVAALLEGIPIFGLVFMISNRVGAAMWAHDLEKRQHYIAEERLNKTH